MDRNLPVMNKNEKCLAERSETIALAYPKGTVKNRVKGGGSALDYNLAALKSVHKIIVRSS